MRLEDFIESLKDFWFEYRRQRIGLIGLGLLIFFVIMALFAPLVAPAEASRRWGDLLYWKDYPKAAKPSWVKYFISEKLPEHVILTEYNFSKRAIGTRLVEAEFTFDYYFKYDVPHTEVILKYNQNISKESAPPTLIVNFQRPDGYVIELLSIKAHETGREARLRISSEQSFINSVKSFSRKFESEELMEKLGKEFFNPMIPLFSKAQEGMISPEYSEPLKGKYKIIVTFYLNNPEDVVENVTVILGGKLYGLLGTDVYRRDLFVGLVWGSRVSLTIGIVTSVLMVTAGILYGITSAYLGGYKDELMQRIYEIVSSIPVLPILIMIAAVYRLTIWKTIGILMLFGWVGGSRVARSMAFQIKEMEYVDAARAMGASSWWIIRKHILPQIIPYAFASMALSVPGNVLLEAGLSFLGLGDLTRVTWGRILHDAQANAATINGLWWWVLPPGLAIALLGLGFAFIGAALNTILFPKMKTI